ncbi:MAG: hypothetical protein OHK0024_31010 [Thalassobaculales bacterium]
MRIVAIVGSYNEALYVRPCLDHYIAQGVEVFLIDNESQDDTVEIAREYLGRGLIGIEIMPRHGEFRLEEQLRRKEAVAERVKADWFLHADMDEIRLPPAGEGTLASAIAEADRAGYSAINFRTYLFLPTVEEPDHEHEDFQRTMRWYCYMEPAYPHQVKGWRQPAGWGPAQPLRHLLYRRGLIGPRAQLARSAGHRVEFPGRRLSPRDFILKHYQVLSLRHAIEKYVDKSFSSAEMARGWHGWKAVAERHNLRLPHQSELRAFVSDAALDRSEPQLRTPMFVG